MLPHNVFQFFQRNFSPPQGVSLCNKQFENQSINSQINYRKLILNDLYINFKSK